MFLLACFCTRVLVGCCGGFYRGGYIEHDTSYVFCVSCFLFAHVCSKIVVVGSIAMVILSIFTSTNDEGM